MDNEKKNPVAPDTMNEVSETAAAQGEERKPAEAEAEATAAGAAEDEATGSDEDTAVVETVESEAPGPAEEKSPKSTRAPKKPKGTAAGKRGAKRAPVKGKRTAAVGAKAASAETAVAEAVEEAPESKLPMKWYVIHTYSGHENKVKENIQKMVKTSGVKEQFGRLIVPTEEVAEMRKGKKTITTRKFFPSYILIEMFMSEDSWHLVNDIPGVTSFVGAGTKPQPLAEAEVERILGRMDRERETITPEIPFTLGEHIRIKDGPFSDFTGIVDEINTEKGKLRVLVSIFGRETPVELDFLQVEPI